MSFRQKLFLLILIPFILLTALQIGGLQQLIKQIRKTREQYEISEIQTIASRIELMLRMMENAAINLSRPVEIRNALERGDNNTLYDWSSSFTQSFDTILFSDQDGIVIARAPDEFRFGDSIAHLPFFTGTPGDECYLGVTELDGVNSITVSRLIKKYNDVVLGNVTISIAITPARLATLVRDPGEILLVYTNSERVSSNDSIRLRKDAYRELPYTEKFAPVLSHFRITFTDFSTYMRLLELQRSMTISSLLALFITSLVLFLLLRRELRPYSYITYALIHYAEQKSDLASTREQLETIPKNTNRDAGRIAAALLRMLEAVQSNLSHIETIAQKDALTGLANRRSLDSLLTAEIEKSARYFSPLSVILLDIDHFKEVNDNFGHQSGDTVLKRLAALLEANSRSSDLIGRWGGEEFMIISPGSSSEKARIYAEKLRDLLENQNYSIKIQATGSFGIAGYQSGDSVSSLIERADRALYRAKTGGRNRVEIEPPDQAGKSV
jgi:diguanylate cyclase (GGDEF)-like protein